MTPDLRRSHSRLMPTRTQQGKMNAMLTSASPLDATTVPR